MRETNYVTWKVDKFIVDRVVVVPPKDHWNLFKKIKNLPLQTNVKEGDYNKKNYFFLIEYEFCCDFLKCTTQMALKNL